MLLDDLEIMESEKAIVAAVTTYFSLVSQIATKVMELFRF